MVVVVAASEALSIYTKSGPFVRGKELSEVALPEPPKKRKPPRKHPKTLRGRFICSQILS